MKMEFLKPHLDEFIQHMRLVLTWKETKSEIMNKSLNKRYVM